MTQVLAASAEGLPEQRADLLGLLASGLRVVVATTDQELVGGLSDLGANLLVLTEGAADLTRNNAQVLVLGGDLVRAAVSFRSLRHARYVVLASTSSGLMGTLQATAKHVVRGRLQRIGQARLTLPDGGSRRLVGFRVTRPAGVRARHWLSPEVGIDGFLRALTEAQVRHVVLRWADELPDLPAGEDLDLLVDDDDVERVHHLLDARPGCIPVDVYSRSGLPGSDWHDMAYHPPVLAEELLASAVPDERGYSTPGPREQLLALAYHAAYQKGDVSGLPRDPDRPPLLDDPDHDYAGALQRLAEAAGVTVEPTLAGLDQLLVEHGWRPPRDTLAKLAEAVPWVAELQQRLGSAEAVTCPGLAVFVLRDRAVQRGLTDQLVDRIRSEGFTVVAQRRLVPASAARFAAAARGANWGRGPWPLSGGNPAVVVLAVDVRPVAPDAALAARWPGLDNARLRVKDALRDLANAGVPPEHRCNVVHASDNAAQAEDYLRLAMPAEADGLLAEAQHLLAEVPVPAGRVRPLGGNGRRGWVEQVEVDGRVLVRKTFRPGCERYLEREVFAATVLAADCPAVPRLVARDAHSLLLPWYDDVLCFDDRRLRLLPLPVVREALAVLRHLYDLGYAVIDCRPHNILVDRYEGLKVIDFEFLHRYEDRPASFAASYDLAGIPAGFNGDLPVLLRAPGWEQRWQPWAGLTLDQALRAPGWLQHLLRARFAVLHLAPARAAIALGRARRALLRRLRKSSSNRR
jgi:hypothetical protein